MLFGGIGPRQQRQQQQKQQLIPIHFNANFELIFKNFLGRFSNLVLVRMSVCL